MGDFDLKAGENKASNTICAPNFKLQEIYKFPQEYGSQVAMASDDKGRLYVSGQKRKDSIASLSTQILSN